MSLVAPLWLLGLVALAPLTMAYLLKVRPRRHPVTAMFLWQTLFKEDRATSLLHRLRDILSLLLLALVTVLLVLAACRPRLATPDDRTLVLVVDTSASMAATGSGGERRIDMALAELRSIVRDLDGNRRAAIATVDGAVRYRAHTTSDPRTLLDAIDGIDVTQRPLRLDALDELVDPAAEEQAVRVVLLSDTATEAFSLPDGIELFRIDEARDNLAITGADIRVIPDDQGTWAAHAWLELQSSLDRVTTHDVVLSLDGAMRKLVSVDVAPGRNDPIEVVVPLDDPRDAVGVWSVRLDADDPLSLDDAIELVLELPPPVAVSIAAEDTWFFGHAVQAFDRSGRVLRLAAEGGEVRLVQGAPPDDAASREIVFGPTGDGRWWRSIGDEVERPVGEVVIPDHPALRWVDIATMPFDGARDIEPCADALVLVASDDGTPLVWIGRAAGACAVVVNVDPRRGDLYLSPWFPVMVHAAATFLAGRDDSIPAVVRTDAQLRVPGASAAERARVQLQPPGASEPLPAERRSDVGPLDPAGVWTVRTPIAEHRVASALLDPGESTLGDDTASTAGPIGSGARLAALLTIAAIAVLVVEAALYHRRFVG